MRRLLSGLAFSLCAMLIQCPTGQAAESAADFYKGKTVFLQIGSETGGGYDLYGRAVARHMAKHIPGQPHLVVQNVIGGGSLVLANQFGNTTSKDGTYFGLFGSGMATTPLLDPVSAKFDSRQFQFIGSPTQEIEVLVVWHTAPAKKLEDVFTTEIIAGASSPGSATVDFPLVTNVIHGTKFKIISGYQGATEVKLAMQRGEVHSNTALAYGSAKTQYAELLKSGELKILAQYGHKHPDIPEIPLFPNPKDPADQPLYEMLLARGDYGRPFAAPPGTPEYLVKALRKAFDDTMKDPEFLADAAKTKLEINPVTGEELQKMTAKLFATSPETIEKLRTLTTTKVAARNK